MHVEHQILRYCRSGFFFMPLGVGRNPTSRVEELDAIRFVTEREAMFRQFATVMCRPTRLLECKPFD